MKKTILAVFFVLVQQNMHFDHKILGQQPVVAMRRVDSELVLQLFLQLVQHLLHGLLLALHWRYLGLGLPRQLVGGVVQHDGCDASHDRVSKMFLIHFIHILFLLWLI